MKKLLLFLIAALTLSGAFAMESFWKTDLNAASKTASEKKLPMLLLFTAPQWCPPCQYLEKNIVSSEAFKELATKKAVALYVVTPQGHKLSEKQIKQNKALQSKYEVRGFPTMVILGANGKELGRITGARETAKEYMNEIQKILKK